MSDNAKKRWGWAEEIMDCAEPLVGIVRAIDRVQIPKVLTGADLALLSHAASFVFSLSICALQAACDLYAVFASFQSPYSEGITHDVKWMRQLIQELSEPKASIHSYLGIDNEGGGE